MKYKFILQGEVPSKKNNWHFSSTGRVFTDPKVKRWVIDSFWLLKPVLRKIKTVTVPCAVELIFYVCKDKDLDNMVGSMFDLLQKSGILENDKLVVKLTAQKNTVLSNPKVFVSIE